MDCGDPCKEFLGSDGPVEESTEKNEASRWTALRHRVAKRNSQPKRGTWGRLASMSILRYPGWRLHLTCLYPLHNSTPSFVSLHPPPALAIPLPSFVWEPAIHTKSLVVHGLLVRHILQLHTGDIHTNCLQYYYWTSVNTFHKSVSDMKIPGLWIAEMNAV